MYIDVSFSLVHNTIGAWALMERVNSGKNEKSQKRKIYSLSNMEHGQIALREIRKGALLHRSVLPFAKFK